MTKFKSGDMVFLPSDLTLIKNSIASEGKIPKKFHKTDAPIHALVVEIDEDGPYCSILYNGEQWSVPKNSVYPVQ